MVVKSEKTRQYVGGNQDMEQFPCLICCQLVTLSLYHLVLVANCDENALIGMQTYFGKLNLKRSDLSIICII